MIRATLWGNRPSIFKPGVILQQPESATSALRKVAWQASEASSHTFPARCDETGGSRRRAHYCQFRQQIGRVVFICDQRHSLTEKTPKSQDTRVRRRSQAKRPRLGRRYSQPGRCRFALCGSRISSEIAATKPPTVWGTGSLFSAPKWLDLLLRHAPPTVRRLGKSGFWACRGWTNACTPTRSFSGRLLAVLPGFWALGSDAAVPV